MRRLPDQVEVGDDPQGLMQLLQMLMKRRLGAPTPKPGFAAHPGDS